MKCKLCLNDTDLVNSHIIPEFFFKPLYEKVGNSFRFNVVPLDNSQNLRYKQKGLTEKLLCINCEKQLSIYEDHARRVFYGGIGIWIKNGNPIEISGIDYSKFKLFQLSILWRASVSNLDFFQGVQLGPHEESIRLMIKNENPGIQLKYPCIFVMILMGNSNPVDAFIYQPEMLRIDGQRAYRFIFGGCFWLYFVSKHTNRISFPEYVIRENGTLFIPLKRSEETEFFRVLSSNIVKRGIL